MRIDQNLPLDRSHWPNPSSTNRLDIVAVGIDQECGEIGRAVIAPQTCSAIVASSGFDAVGVKFPDRLVLAGPERDVGAADASLMLVEPQRRFALRAETRAIFVAGAEDVTERGERRGIEADAGVEIADFDADVVVHGCLPGSRLGKARKAETN